MKKQKIRISNGGVAWMGPRMRMSRARPLAASDDAVRPTLRWKSNCARRRGVRRGEGRGQGAREAGREGGGD